MKEFNIPEFLNREEEYKFLASNRWPDGKIFCPVCNNPSVREIGGGYYYCAQCVKNSRNGKFNATTGTSLSRYKIRLSGFLYAAQILNMGEKGLSVADLAQKLKISLATANLILKKLCRLNDAEMSYILGAFAPQFSRKLRAKNHHSAKIFGEIPGFDYEIYPFNGNINQSMIEQRQIYWVTTRVEGIAVTGYGADGLQYEISPQDDKPDAAVTVTKQYWLGKTCIYSRLVLANDRKAPVLFNTIAEAQHHCEQDFSEINNPHEIEWFPGDDENILFGFNDLDSSTYNIFQRPDQSCYVKKNFIDGREQKLKTNIRLSLSDAKSLCMVDLKNISSAGQ